MCDHIIDFDAKWVVDSVASYHCVLKREYFSTYRTENFGRVKTGSDNVVDIVGISNIYIQANVDCKVVLKNVGYIPGLCLNMISMSALDKNSYKHQHVMIFGSSLRVLYLLLKASFVVHFIRHT